LTIFKAFSRVSTSTWLEAPVYLASQAGKKQKYINQEIKKEAGWQ